MRKLTNVNATHVSYVDKPANKKKFFMLKNEGGNTMRDKKKLFNQMTGDIEAVIKAGTELGETLQNTENEEQLIQTLQNVVSWVLELEKSYNDYMEVREEQLEEVKTSVTKGEFTTLDGIQPETKEVRKQESNANFWDGVL